RWMPVATHEFASRPAGTDPDQTLGVLGLEHSISPRVASQAALTTAPQPHSALMLAALMIGHHFSISALWKVASASGVCCSRGEISSPRSASRARTAGSAKASTIAAFSLPMTLLGVPLGAQYAYQCEMWSPASPASSTVGIPGAAAKRVLVVTA